MPLHLDHLMVPSRNKVAAAKLLAELLGGPVGGNRVRAILPRLCERGLDARL